MNRRIPELKEIFLCVRVDVYRKYKTLSPTFMQSYIEVTHYHTSLIITTCSHIHGPCIVVTYGNTPPSNAFTYHVLRLGAVTDCS